MASDSSPPPAAPSGSSSSSKGPSTSVSPSTSSPYPYAYAPDIIRSHQKDAYFQGVLANQLTDLHRRLRGARSAHAWAAEARTAADVLYLGLTTLLGNRTLGEEYCGLVQVEADDPRHGHPGGALPALPRRAAYIAGSILLPYGLSRVLPGVRARLRARLQRSLARAEMRQQQQQQRRRGGEEDPKKKKTQTQSWTYRLQRYVLANLGTLTSPASVHALTLALFYFTGSYYELAKRLAGLRYVFTHKVGGDDESAERAGYEVLGVLLVVQMTVQAYLHVRATLSSPESSSSSTSRERTTSPGAVHVSLDEHAYSANNAMMLPATAVSSTMTTTTNINLALATHTPPPPPDGAHCDLGRDAAALRWVHERKCTLCLEELKDPAATPCGHVFCWACIGDWVREKPECPLCRRAALVQHVLPLRAV